MEDKDFAISICESIINETYPKRSISILGYQYINWNKHLQYKTKSFIWLHANVSLITSMENKDYEKVLIHTLSKIQNYSDLNKLIKDEQELTFFNKFTKVIPLFK